MDVSKFFYLCVNEDQGTAEALGPWKKSAAYLPKRLDPVSACWPVCEQLSLQPC